MRLMDLPGRLGAVTLPDGRHLDVWDGGDPDGGPVLFMPGTPSCRWQAALGHKCALAAGHRLISLSRPGYGGSDDSPPGLASVGQDAVDLADALDLDRFAVLGLSGGGPYAVAAALAAGPRVTTLGVVAGIGPWAVLNEPDGSDDLERSLLARAAAGDVQDALAGFREEFAGSFEALLGQDDGAMIDDFLGLVLAGDEDLFDESFRAVWIADVREGLRSYDGYARDNVSWGLAWDIDPGGVRVPTQLWYGAQDRDVPPAHGRWLADQIAGSRLTVRSGQDHGHVAFRFWDETFAAL